MEGNLAASGAEASPWFSSALCRQNICLQQNLHLLLLMVQKFVLLTRGYQVHITAALKAYPKSETVPCEQFEAAFKAAHSREGAVPVSSQQLPSGIAWCTENTFSAIHIHMISVSLVVNHSKFHIVNGNNSKSELLRC
ncbi:hypothetical protein Q3G72_014194 [Acer saccharum]|nr:hypothetical protein Q3G72_014194 [Acer saccharum]